KLTQHLSRCPQGLLIARDLSRGNQRREHASDALGLAGSGRCGRRRGFAVGCAVDGRCFCDLADGAAVVFAVLNVDLGSPAQMDAGELFGPDLKLGTTGSDDGPNLLAGLGRVSFSYLDQHGATSRTWP